MQSIRIRYDRCLTLTCVGMAGLLMYQSHSWLAPRLLVRNKPPTNGTVRGKTTAAPSSSNSMDSPLITPWGASLDPERVLVEYPRPGLVRDRWLSLNGFWYYAIVNEPGGEFSADGQILVPFCIESKLSGVKRRLQPSQLLVYKRDFVVPSDWQGDSVRINFEAVDYEATVLVNGRVVGHHAGGYDAFSFDITEHLTELALPQTIMVYVKDPTESQAIPLGKQWSGGNKSNRFIFYESTTGIWQSVWLEPVSSSCHVARLNINTDVLTRSVSVETVIELGTATAALEVGTDVVEVAREVVVKVLQQGREVATARGQINSPVNISVGEDGVLWSPAHPHLYDIVLQLWEGDRVVDTVTSYFGIRSIEIREVEGAQRIFLNNQLLSFQVGPLDQGYWPDGLLTAPSEEALLFDLQLVKELGFNMVRKHIKVESRRWYYHADRMGILVWQDFPSVSDVHAMENLIDAQENFAREYRLWMQQLHNHPSIILWVVFNEAWGQFRTVEVTKAVMELDPSRLVTGASGWTDYPVGHVADAHVYPGPSNNGTVFAPVDKNRTSLIGEMWGQSLIIPGHNWFGDAAAEADPRGGVSTAASFLQLYSLAIQELQQLAATRNYTAAVMTQLSDVEGELNGFVTYDRRIFKVDAQQLAKLNKKLLPEISSV